VSRFLFVSEVLFCIVRTAFKVEASIDIVTNFLTCFWHRLGTIESLLPPRRVHSDLMDSYDATSLGLNPVMICPQCQRENLPDSIFCEHCGARFETVCSHCGQPYRRGASFCRMCGQTLNQAATVTPDEVPGLPSPDKYVPRHLAEKILASRQFLEGERKQVTVLFADIRGSTSLLEGLDPEDAQKLIDPVLWVMMDAVHRYEGTVNQVLGDGIMALFGAPLAHEDHAVRACYAALAMQEEMRRYRRKLGQSEELGLQIGIGFNSGEVVVRSISNDLNVDYSALGHTTHMAARMQELAAGGTILMTSSTLRQVEGFVQVKSVGAVQAKGVSRPVEAFELVAATTARTRVQAAAVRGLTPLVGRRAEIEVFSKLMEEAGTGKGQILAMVGEPGMGKSRLVHEFARHQLRPGWLVLEAASVSYGKATPYFPLIEMLRRYFQISDSQGSEDIREQVVMHILELDNVLKDAIPPVLFLLGALPDEANPPPALAQFKEVVEATHRYLGMDPQQRRRYTFEAIKRVLIRESQRQPLLIIFEDLHWIDGETQSFLDSLVESLPMARILLLVDYRPEYIPRWGDKTYYTQLRVDPLQATSAEELLQYLLGSHIDLAPLKQLLIHRTEGNPFFAEESVRSLVETGFLVGEKGAYRPGLKIHEIRIPNTVQNVLADRIDRLPPEEKRLLQTAAVIGVIVPFGLLRAVAELPDEGLHRCLSHLQSAEFLYETNLFPESEYSFKHALTNEVTYSALLHDRRTNLHARVVNVLEASTQNVFHDRIEKLAHHAFSGELWDKAVGYLKDAGDMAVSRSSFRNSVLHYERALEALQRLPESSAKLRRGIDLRFDARNALFVLNDFKRGFEHLEEAKKAATTLHDEERLGKLLTWMTAHWNLAGNSEQAVITGKQALEHTSGPKNFESNIVAHNWLGVAYHNLGQFGPSIHELETALSLLTEERKYDLLGTAGIVSVNCKAWLIRGLAQIGKFRETIQYGEQAIQTATERERPLSIVFAYYAVGAVAVIKGDFDQAIAALEHALKVCEAAELPVQRPLVVSGLAAAYAFVGRFDDALRLLESTANRGVWVIEAGSRQAPLGKAMGMVWEVEAYMLAGRYKEAETLARQNLAVFADSKDRGSVAWQRYLLGETLMRCDASLSRQAEASYREALALARELGMCPLEAHCYLGLGRAHARLNDLAKARAELVSAAELYRSVSMQFWLSKAEAALADLS
jgi:class 3 adenylate cyclase/tetratricopeptide (TPR) repeat protein